jgi:Fur family peroxide stress response transcriptional regulator
LKLDEDIIESRLKAFAGMCKEHGIMATHQRTEIYRELAGTTEHPSAEVIYKRVRARIPAISLDTVYRTLRLLEARGVISRAGAVEDRARFDANTARHHHFVCTECGRIGDFYSETLDHLPVPPEVARMGSVDVAYVELRGRCRKCQTGGENQKRDRRKT